MNSTLLILRKKSIHFNSIENVFSALLPFLSVYKIDLPFESIGIRNRIKNILFLRGQKAEILHITGHDHYLLWWPFNNAVLTIHDIEALKRKTGLKRWIFKKMWFDWPIWNAKVVTTISEFSKNEIQSIGKYKTPIVVIPNPLTLSMKYIPKEFNERSFRILHLGTKKNKNVKRLLEALKGIECTLVIIGALSDELKSLIQKYKLVVEAKQNLSNEAITDEYRNCDILSFVSTYEGFGLPILEAQAIGRPVITSNCASMPEVAGKGALLVDPFNVNAIREGVIQLIEDNSLRESLIKYGLENVKQYEPTQIAKKYRMIYDSLND